MDDHILLIKDLEILEPYTSNIETSKNFSREFGIVKPHMVNDLIKEN